MIIRVDSIPDEGLSFDETRPVEWLTNFPDLVAGKGMTASGPVTFRIKVTRLGEQVHVRGAVHVTIQTQCSRCAGEVSAEVEAPADVILERLTSDRKGKEFEDEGYGVYSGEEIDLADHLRGQLALYFPTRFLCKPDCKGLCPHCGADLNMEPCRCQKVATDPRWAALKKIKF